MRIRIRRARPAFSALAISAVAVAGLVACAGSTAKSAGGGATKPGGSFDPGIDSAAALANPKCDPRTKRIKFEHYAAAPCVKPWPAGSNNGGATAQGVTATSIKVVVLWSTPS